MRDIHSHTAAIFDWFSAERLTDSLTRLHDGALVSNAFAYRPGTGLDIPAGAPAEMGIFAVSTGHSGSLPDLTSSLAFNGATLFVTIQNHFPSNPAPSSITGIYLSTDNIITSGDTLLSTRPTANLNQGVSISYTVALPLTGALAPGTYYMGAIANYDGAVTESDTTNNASNAAPIILGDNNANALAGTAGEDHVFALGGDDTINIGATMTAQDSIDGGTGTDTVLLNGDYSFGLVFGATTMLGVETLRLGGGFSYNLTTDNQTVAAGQMLTVDASALTAGNLLTFNGSADFDGRFTVNLGAAFTAADRITGGNGNDTLVLDGDYTGANAVAFSSTTLTKFETIRLTGGHSYNLTTVSATVAAGATLTVDGSALGAANSLTFNGASDGDSHFNITGGAGNDILTGGALADAFGIGSGGNDAVQAGAGNDTIYVGGTLTAADSINGGADFDTVTLNGNYSAGVVFGAATMVNVEALSVSGGHSYNLTTNNTTVAAGQTLNVMATTLGAGDTFVFNGSAETDGKFSFNIGTGFTAADSIRGGSGNDALILNGDYVGATALVFTPTTLLNVETLQLTAGHSYSVTTSDATVAAGQTLTVWGPGAIDSVAFNGSAETDGKFYIYGGGGNNAIGGGSGNDIVNMASYMTAADKIDGGGGFDTLVLNGNYSSGSYSSGLTLAATTLTSIEQLTLVGHYSYNLTTNDANVASGATLNVVASAFTAGDTLTFNGAAEIDGKFNITAGAGNDTLTGGAGADTFNFTAINFSWGDTVAGGGGVDRINFTTAGTIAPDAFTHVTGIETIVLANGTNNITLTNALVGSASATTLTVNGNAGADTIDGSAVTTAANKLVIHGGGGADILTAGAGADSFTYGIAADSTSTQYDTITGFNFSSDKFDVPGTIAVIDGALITGALDSGANFDTELTAAMNGHLGIHHAELFTPDSGTLSGQTFLIVDVNGVAGYQTGADLVFHMTAASGTLVMGDFN